jgi:CO/xanthine dehydrogenase Mo-binding subunit
MLGDRIVRYDGVGHVTGTTRFIDDIRIPGMLHVKAIQSPHSHARILRMSVAKAQEFPGVVLVLTSGDIPKNRYGIAGDHHVMADEYVRYVGQLVAAVVAVDETTAEKAAGLIEIEYEPLEAVLDPLEAMKPGAVQIREHGNIYRFGKSDKRVVRMGNVEEGFKSADFIFEDTFSTPVQAHGFLETHVGVATFDESSRLLVYTTGQSIHWIHPLLADVLQMPKEQIRVVGGVVGGGFGGKSDLSVEPVIAVAALKTGKPVKWRWTLQEELTLPTVRGAYQFYYKTGVKKDGTITARYVRAIHDIGAFCYRGTRVLDRQGTVAGGPYRLPHYWYDGYGVHTNKIPAAALRGFGVAPVMLAVEAHTDRIAREMGMDPLEFRWKNLLADGDIGYRGSRLEKTSARECLEQVERYYRREWKESFGAHIRRGRGVAVGVMPIGLTAGVPPVAVQSHVTADGRVVIAVNTTDLGQGARTVFTQIASEVLEIPENGISVTMADSALYPNCAGSGAQQVTYVTGNALKTALEKIRHLCIDVAAKHWSVAEDQVVFSQGRASLKSGRASLGIAELAAIAMTQEKVLSAAGVYKTETVLPDEETGLGRPYEEYGYGAAYAEVSVDTETGQVSVDRLVSAVDAGRAINPMLVEGQIEGGAAMNLGYALMEDLYPAYPKDKYLASGFHEYLVPTSQDVPHIESIIVEKKSLKGPFGAKGIGETTASAIAPAVANAVANALGMMTHRLPLTSERVLTLLKRRPSVEEGKEHDKRTG